MASRITILSMEVHRAPLSAELRVRIDSTNDPGLQAGDELVLELPVASVRRSGKSARTNDDPGALPR